MLLTLIYFVNNMPSMIYFVGLFIMSIFFWMIYVQKKIHYAMWKYLVMWGVATALMLIGTWK